MSNVLLQIAKVLEAGAEHSRGWTYNQDRQQDAEVLQVMADKARELAQRKQP